MFENLQIAEEDRITGLEGLSSYPDAQNSSIECNPGEIWENNPQRGTGRELKIHESSFYQEYQESPPDEKYAAWEELWEDLDTFYKTEKEEFKRYAKDANRGFAKFTAFEQKGKRLG